MIVDSRRQQREHSPIHINMAAVESQKLQVPEDLCVVKVQRRLFKLRRLKKFCVPPKTLTN
jgi:hypothetical protein